MLDFVRDIFSAFKQASIERIKSPILGAFVFSWLSFNWEVPAILIMSKKSIENNIDFINSNFGYVSFLILPITTTLLICYILPHANKWITKLQGEPNSETLMMQLNDKISVGGQQLELAEIEARKELAKTKVEKEIERNIDLTLEQNDALQYKINTLEIEIEDNKNSINELTVSRDTLINSQKSDKELIGKLHKEIEDKENENKSYSEQINGLKLTNQEIKLHHDNLVNKQLSLESELVEKSKKLQYFENVFSDLKDCFPNIFINSLNSQGICTTAEALDKISSINDGEWKYKSHLSTQFINRVELTEIKKYFQNRQNART